MKGTNAGKVYYSNYTPGKRNGLYRIKFHSDGVVGGQNRDASQHARADQEGGDTAPGEEMVVDSLALMAEIETLKKKIDNLKIKNENNINALKARHSLKIAWSETEHLESDNNGMVSIHLHKQEMGRLKADFQVEKARFEEVKVETELQFAEGLQTLERKKETLDKASVSNLLMNVKVFA